MNKSTYFSLERTALGKENWFFFLRILKKELAVFLDCEILETGTFWDGEDTTYANFSCNLDLIANVFPEASLQYGGVLSYSKNYEKAVYVDVFFLAFMDGKRIESNDKAFKYLWIDYHQKTGWSSPRWLSDVYGEWESYTDMERWTSQKDKKIIK